MVEKKFEGFFGRLEAITKHFGISSINELGKKYLGYRSAEKLNRLKSAGKAPSAEIIADLVVRWPQINANWLLTGQGEMIGGETNAFAQKETEARTEPEANKIVPDYNPGQIASMLAEAFRDQKEILKIHARWLESIENKMAQESTQAKILEDVKDVKSTLGNLWNGLFVASSRQAADREQVLPALSKLTGHKDAHLLKEANKKAAELLKASDVQDNMPA
jgi:hypothetical protein